MRAKSILESMSPKEALQKLIDGNVRFQNGQLKERNYKQKEKGAVEHYPFAIILGCMDARVPVEILFDQGIGDVFVTRVAGNIENEDSIASMEYACEVMGSKVIMVLGHQDCGAVKAACNDVKIGHIPKLTVKIKPAISQTKTTDVDAIAKTNVKLTIQRIREKSTILSTLEKENKLQIVGAYYEISTRKVFVLDN